MGDISLNLSRKECACKCGCGFDDANVRLTPVFELCREFLGGTSLTPNSVCRCEEHNERVQLEANSEYVPYSSRSKHMYGTAMDIPTATPEVAKELYTFLDTLFPSTYGIGLYSWGVHVDVRNEKARW